MKTTLDLPDELMRAVKIRAAERNMKLREVVADALRAALAAPATSVEEPLDPVQAWARQLVCLPDGSFNNPKGVDDTAYFEGLEARRAESRSEPLRNPFDPA